MHGKLKEQHKALSPSLDHNRKHTLIPRSQESASLLPCLCVCVCVRACRCVHEQGRLMTISLSLSLTLFPHPTLPSHTQLPSPILHLSFLCSPPCSTLSKLVNSHTHSSPASLLHPYCTQPTALQVCMHNFTEVNVNLFQQSNLTM